MCKGAEGLCTQASGNVCSHRRANVALAALLQVVRKPDTCGRGAGPPHTPCGGASTPLWGGVSQGATTQTQQVLAWDFPSQGGERPTLGDVPWHFYFTFSCIQTTFSLSRLCTRALESASHPSLLCRDAVGGFLRGLALLLDDLLIFQNKKRNQDTYGDFLRYQESPG